MNKLDSSLEDVLNNSKMPISSYSVKTYFKIKEEIRKQKLEKYEDENFLTLREMQTSAKVFCQVCSTAIFEEGGECPNCD